MPEERGGFAGFAGLNLVEDAWEATLRYEALDQLTELWISCHSEAIGEVIAAPWEAIWKLNVRFPRSLVCER